MNIYTSKIKSKFNATITEDKAFLLDLCNEFTEAKSITNDAENVVNYILRDYPEVKIIFYRDTHHDWGILEFDENGNFTDFGVINENHEREIASMGYNMEYRIK